VADDNSEAMPIDQGPEFDKIVGANIRRYRTARGLSQVDLAEALSQATSERIHQQTIQKIEKGTRPLKYSEAINIASVLEIPTYMLTSGLREGEANSILMSSTTELKRRRDALSAFAEELAPSLVDLALILAAIEQSSQDDEAGDTEPVPQEDDADAGLGVMVSLAEIWLTYNWGKELNREIMTALRKQDFLTDLRDEFDAPTYLEVLQQVKAAEIRPIHPAQSRLAPLGALKWRPRPADATEA
jgi:transcriptional regulator with XRE-family HTH domain